jgi:hypothetical protein
LNFVENIEIISEIDENDDKRETIVNEIDWNDINELRIVRIASNDEFWEMLVLDQ